MPLVHINRLIAMMHRLLLTILVCSLSSSLPAQGHEHAASQSVVPPRSATQGAGSGPTLFETLGTYGRPLGKVTPMAQRWFDQGLRLTWAFGHADAVRSFRTGLAVDSTCAMCWWGVAWASGPYLNDPASDSLRLTEAYAAARRAQALAGSARPVDRALIDAMVTRYEPVPVTEHRAARDSAYAQEMTMVAARFPADDDVQALLGEARLLVAEWDQLYSRDRRATTHTAWALLPFETVLSRNLRHPGACHLYIHATEAGPEPGKAERCADQLGDGMPGASHILHMPSHVYHRVGRWGDAVRANQRAVMADQYGVAGGVPGVYPLHNLAMLVGGAVMDGQRAVSLDALRAMARQSPSDEVLLMVALARFGEWSEIRAMRPRTDNPVATAWSAVAFGLALLDTAQIAPARAQLGLTDALLTSLRGPSSETTRDSSAVQRAAQTRHRIVMARGILAGELMAARGQVDSAVAALEEAVAAEDSLEYEEHDLWSIPPRHVLGGLLLDAGRAAQAERVLRADLVKRPRNGWALRGLQQALEGQGKADEAARVQREFETAWSRADSWLPGPRYRPGQRVR